MKIPKDTHEERLPLSPPDNRICGGYQDAISIDTAFFESDNDIKKIFEGDDEVTEHR